MSAAVRPHDLFFVFIRELPRDFRDLSVNFHELFHVRAKLQCVFAHEFLSEVGVAFLDGFDNHFVIGDRALGAVLLKDCTIANCANVHKQAVADLLDQTIATRANNGLMTEADVGVGI